MAVLGLLRELFLQSPNNLLTIQLLYWKSHNFPLFKECWGELLGCSNNYCEKRKILRDCWSIIFLSTFLIQQLDWGLRECWRCSQYGFDWWVQGDQDGIDPDGPRLDRDQHGQEWIRKRIFLQVRNMILLDNSL